MEHVKHEPGVIPPPPSCRPLPEIRLRSERHPDDLKAMRGKLALDTDYRMLLTGPVKVLKPDRSPLCVYLPGELLGVLDRIPETYDVLHMLRKERTDNRGDASGTPRAKRGDQKRTRSSLVPSAIIGAVDPGGIYPFCRLTSWTGRHLDNWSILGWLFEAMDEALRRQVFDRWAAQRAAADQVQPEWRITDTTFTTVTVNNTYASGYHYDDGDLESGFSTLAVLRRGEYKGGVFVFPRWRIGVDMRDNDLLLLDAHEMHGNTTLRWPDGEPAEGDRLPDGSFERISVVAYLRSAMTECDSADDEMAKAQASAARRSGHTP